MFSLQNMITCGVICILVGACLGMVMMGLVSGNTWEDGYTTGYKDGHNSKNT
jgi:hypothetical protein